MTTASEKCGVGTRQAFHYNSSNLYLLLDSDCDADSFTDDTTLPAQTSNTTQRWLLHSTHFSRPWLHNATSILTHDSTMVHLSDSDSTVVHLFWLLTQQPWMWLLLFSLASISYAILYKHTHTIESILMHRKLRAQWIQVRLALQAGILWLSGQVCLTQRDRNLFFNILVHWTEIDWENALLCLGTAA